MVKYSLTFLPSCPVQLNNSFASTPFVNRRKSPHNLTRRRPFRRTIVSVVDGKAVSEERLKPHRVFETFIWRGHEINYRVEGPPDGPHVLLIHGFGASIQHWRKNWSALVNSGCRVYAVDLLGFGASAKPDLGVGGYNLELWRDLCVDFVEEFGKPGKPFVLVGNSIGSLVGLMTAIAVPGRVRGLCLIACAGGLVPFRQSELNPLGGFFYWLFITVMFNNFTGPRLFRRFRTRENVLSSVTQAYAGGADAIDDDLLDILCSPGEDNGADKVFLAILNGPAGPTPEELISATQWCPTLILWGSDDPFTPLRDGFHPGIRFPHYNPSVKLVELEGAGHCPHDSRPEWVNGYLASFVLDPETVAPINSIPGPASELQVID